MSDDPILRCIACAAVIPPGKTQCACGEYQFAERGLRPSRRARGAHPTGPFPFHTLLLRPGTIGIVTGPPGIGKSTLVHVLDPDPWITTEEELADVADRVLRLGRPMPLIVPATTLDEYKFELTLRRGAPPRLHILDSASMYGLQGSRDAVYAMRGFVREVGGIGVCILQYNAQGVAEGLTEVQHAVDWILDVTMSPQGIRSAGFTKNRLGPQETICWRFDEQGRPTRAVDFDGIYSVEGILGAYRLHKYPFKGSTFADPWRAADTARAHDLLRSCRRCATAAVAASYTDDGFVTPEDIADRRRFAEAHGLAWLDLRTFWATLQDRRNSTPTAAVGL